MPTTALRKEAPPQSTKQRLASLLPLSLRRHLIYQRRKGSWGNFRTPTLYSEKMQWRIINDRRPIVGITGDKLASWQDAYQRCAAAGIELARAEIIAVSSSPGALVDQLRALDAEGKLRNDWVLKPNHSSRRALVTRGAPDWASIQSAATRWMKPDDMVGVSWMWAYAAAERKIIAEALIQNDGHQPIEWSVYLFDGEIKMYNVTQRVDEEVRDVWLSSDWEDLGRMRVNERKVLERVPDSLSRTKIAAVAQVIGAQWDHVRVDLYWAEGKVWFGETTAYPMEGTGFKSPEVDQELGALWRLPR